MIKRVSMWRLKDKSRVGEMVRLLNSLEANVDSLQSIEVGFNLSEHSSSYDVVFIGTFADSDALKEFDADPYHKEIGVSVSSLKIDRKVVEFEY
jgi:hypothetical protein